MPNRTISVPDGVVPIIDSLDMPLSRWVTEQLRRHAALAAVPFAQQLATDAAIARADRRQAEQHAQVVGERMERLAPW